MSACTRNGWVYEASGIAGCRADCRGEKLVVSCIQERDRGTTCVVAHYLQYWTERGKQVGWIGQTDTHQAVPWHRTLPFLSLLLFYVYSQVSTSLVIHGPWWTISGQVRAHVLLTCTMGSRPVTFLWLWPATDHEPHWRHVPVNKICRLAESTPQSRLHSHMAGICSDCSTREINNICDIDQEYPSLKVIPTTL